MTDQEKIDIAQKDFSALPAGAPGIIIKSMIFKRYGHHQRPGSTESQIETFVENCIGEKDYEEKSFFLWYYDDQCTR